jgi:hypothetical protein
MVALVVFFTIFSATLSTFTFKNSVINKQVEMVSVARELKGDSLLLSVNDFQNKCMRVNAKRYPYNFIAAIYPSGKDLSKVITSFSEISASLGGIRDFSSNELDIFSEKSSSGGQNYYFCSYQRIGSTPFTGKEKQFLVRYYPVAVQTKIFNPDEPDDETKKQFIIVPGIMALVVWE